ncbi:NAD(P)H-dependent oxidoreductase [Paenibacillus sp. SC116]|uniref:NAD(P)H-dependent oxidoreductase n=1 Tax=Paenibacillus sp. SC116 TaxID=2968986 RepID=UPI00215B5C21|nr:NAD(P)H-dependent oxidoreductase [Paenibacillus sp. SC116]MCR8844528.1 NAD(P)H-dependent oxidoreductase [Paenibacillus sp. SC116]
MSVLVIAVHPNLEDSTINKAWLEELKKHDQVTVHSLYEAYPDEVIDVAREQQLLQAHDRIIFQFPLYWYSSPPLLKKWFDLVLQFGWAFGPDGDHLKDKEIGVATSTHAAAEEFLSTGTNRFTIEELLRPIEATIHFIGATYLPPYALHDVGNLSEEQLEQSKAEYVKRITSTNLSHTG